MKLIATILTALFVIILAPPVSASSEPAWPVDVYKRQELRRAGLAAQRPADSTPPVQQNGVTQ